MNDIVRRPIDDIQWSDIEDLILVRIEESQFLDFKSGQLWSPPNKKEAPRDNACKALVAFANSYGGTLIMGIEEKDDVAVSTDHLVKNLKSTIENLERSIRDYVTPPFPDLQIKAVEKADNEGVILLRVSESQASPHGFGSPASAYKRDGKNSRPMNMHDLQSLFWDARSRRERVEAIREEHHQLLLRKLSEATVRPLDASPVNYEPPPKVFFRVTAIPQTAIHLSEMPIEEWRYSLRPSYHKLNVNGLPFAGDGSFSSRLRRMAHGLCEDREKGRWIISDKGVVSFVGFCDGYMKDENLFHVPSWYTCVVGLAIVMADRLKTAAGVPDANFEIDCEFMTVGKINVVNYDNDLSWSSPESQIAPDDRAEIGPFLMQVAEPLQNVFSALEHEIWGFFGKSVINPLTPNWSCS